MAQGTNATGTGDHIDPAKQFEIYRDGFQREGQRLIGFIAVYRRLHERRHNRLDALNIAPAFFQLVLMSLRTSIIVAAHALFNGGGGNEVSLRTFLNFVSRNINLFSLEQLASRRGWRLGDEYMHHRVAPTADTVRQDRKTIDRIESLKHVAMLRNKRLAHIDADYFNNPTKAAEAAPLKWGDLTELQQTYETIVNRYSSAYDASTLTYKPMNIYDIDDVIEILHRHLQSESGGSSGQ